MGSVWKLGRLLLFAGSSSIALLVWVAGEAVAKDRYVGDIPNGSLNGCFNCHVNGEDPDDEFTDFGTDFKEIGGRSWTPSLATEDSDGDLFTNGEELQEPDGTWTTSDPDPGFATVVSLPGDILNFPPEILILLDVPLIEHEEPQGQNGFEEFEIANNSGGVDLDYSAVVDVGQDWMSLDPASGVISSDGMDSVDVRFDTVALAPASMHAGTITVSADGVVNSPQVIDVLLTVPEPGATALSLAALSTLALVARRRGRV
jgi:hypothetical protein